MSEVRENSKEELKNRFSKICDELEDWLTNCLAENETTADQLNCLSRAYKQWDEELNKICTELEQKLDSQGQKFLKAAQLKWIEYRDKEFALIDTIHSEKGGTMQLLVNGLRRKDFVKTRVKDLHDYYDDSNVIKFFIVRIGNS